MDMIRTPLRMTEAENREALRRRKHDGDSEGNRHDRRLAAKRNRQQRKRELVHDYNI